MFLFSLITFACSKTEMDELSTSITQDSKTKKKNKIDTPIIDCAGSTQTSISITVAAPRGTDATGMPAGFSLQWMTAAEFAANDDQWYASDDPRLCKGSFSGNANLSRYNLDPGESVTVRVGDFLLDQGASTNCSGELVCGTEYVFRAFAHATSTLMRSDFTENIRCSTLACGSNGGGCTYTQGYWKNHGPLGCLSGNNEDEWPEFETISLGTVLYDASKLCQILNTPPKGNGLIALAHQLIAAQLNILNGASNSSISEVINNANNLIGGEVVTPIGDGYLHPSLTNGLTDALADFNEGGEGHPGHCGSR